MEYSKYKKTYHLPWSETIARDDKILQNDNIFLDKYVVVSIKMDGENTSLYCNKLHARSLDSTQHNSRNYVKQLHASIKYKINDLKICGENLYAMHSIHYKNLEDYFLVFNMWKNTTCLDWDTTKKIASELNLRIVPVIYEGIYNKDIIHQAYINYQKSSLDDTEGYVIRNAFEFDVAEFSNNIAKYVRKGHVQENDEHWILKPMIKNLLKQ
jgi:hypothetical protein